MFPGGLECVDGGFRSFGRGGKDIDMGVGEGGRKSSQICFVFYLVSTFLRGS